MARPPGHGPGYERRRQEIIDRAASLFAERGYAATGVAALCNAVGLGKSALYNYIGSKENLLVEIQNRVLSHLLESSSRVRDLEVPAGVRLRLLSQQLLEGILARLDHIWVYEHDYRQLTGENRVRFLAQRREFEALVASLLEEAEREGFIRLHDPRLATLQFLNLHNHTYQWARDSMPWTAADLSSAYFRTLMLGFGASAEAVAEAEAAALRLTAD